MAENNLEILEAQLREANEAILKFYGSMDKVTDESIEQYMALHDLTDAIREAINEENLRILKIKEARKAAVQDLKDSAKMFGNALSDTTGGLDKYSAATSAAGDAAWALGKSFGPLGMVAGGLVKAFTYLVGQANRYNEALTKNFDGINNTGATAALASEDLKAMADKVGLTTHNMDVLYTNVKDLGTNFIMLGGSVSGGMKQFAEMSVSTKELRKEYAALGLSTDQVIALNAQLVKSGALTTVASSRNSKDTAAAAQKLIKEMVTLAELTGVSVDKQMEAIEFSRQNEAYASFILNKQVERDELMAASTAALKRGDQVEADRLANKAAAIDKEMKATDEFIRASAKYDTATRTAILENVASGGAVINAQLTTLGVNMQGISAGLQKGENQIYNFDKQLSDGAIRVNKSLGPLAAFSNGLLTDFGGLSAQNLRVVSDTRTMLTTMTKEEFEANQKRLNAQNLATKAEQDGAVATSLSAKEAELANRKREDALGKMSAEITNGVMQKFFEWIEKANKVIEELINGITKYIQKIKRWLGLADDVEAEVKRKDEERAKPGGAAARGAMAASAAAGAGGGTPTTTGASGGTTGGMSGGGGGGGGGGGTPPERPQGTVGGLLDAIGKKESRGNYNILVGGKTADLTDMTIAEVLKFQESMISRGFESTAVGKYQIINKTLKGLIKETGIGLDQKFDQSTQDMLAMQLLKRRGLDQYLSKKLSPEKFADNLSMEWASLPYNTGQSYYAGVGSNRSGMSRDDFLATLPQALNGGIFSGATTGYPVAMHGTEMITPLDANSILAKLATTSSTEATSKMTENTASSELVSVLVDKLNTMIDKMSNSNDIQSEILTYARA